MHLFPLAAAPSRAPEERARAWAASVFRVVLPFRRLLRVIVQLVLVALSNGLAFWLRFDGAVPTPFATLALTTLPALVLIRAITFMLFGLYRGLWRYTSIRDLRDIIAGVGTGSAVFFLVVRYGFGFTSYPRSVYLIDTMLLICLMGGIRLTRRLSHEIVRRPHGRRVLVYGAGDAGEAIVRDMRRRDHLGYEPIGFVDDDPAKVGMRIHGLPVIGTGRAIASVLERDRPVEVLIAMPSAEPSTIDRIVQDLEPYNLVIKTLPPLSDLFDGGATVNHIKDRIYLSPPDVGQAERRALLEAFDSNWIAPLGPSVDAFEAEMARQVGVKFAVALSSGTAALHLALHVLGVTAGDEVLTSTLTFVATANAAVYLGGHPVFLDVDPRTWTLDPDLLAEELAVAARRGRLPKAIVVVDLYGQCADYDRILALGDKYGVPVVEDAAEALGSSYKGRPAGSFGRVGVLSFNGNKIITTSGGGMLLSNDEQLASRARLLATQAREPVVYYEHREVGFNYRMSNLLAAIGRAQLRGLDRKIQQRRAHNQFYRAALGQLPGVQFMPEAGYGGWNGWLTCITVEPDRFGTDAESLRILLEADNVEARPVWKPMHLQPVFSSCRRRGGAVAADLFQRGLCLPSGSSLTAAERTRIVERIQDAVAQPAPSREPVDLPAAAAIGVVGEAWARSYLKSLSPSPPLRLQAITKRSTQ